MIGKRIAAARKAKKMTQAELASKLGWESQGRISNYEKGIREPSLDDIRKISTILGVTTSELLSENKLSISDTTASQNVHETPQRLVPVISFVQAGEAHEACDMYEAGFAEDYLPCPAPHSECTYALKVVGQSMTSPHGRSYPEGSVVFVDPSLRGDVVSGDRVIARFKKTGEVTFKCYISEGGQQFLKALNPGYLPFTDDFEILGKVIGTWTPE